LCPGFVLTEHLTDLLSHAELFVLPTLYEGFGLPVLEAQHAGVPVASSNVASLPEIGGEGAVYFDPLSVEAIANALHHVLSMNSEAAATLRAAAKQNLARFSWAKSAQGHIEVYEGACRRSSSGNH
jgi:glycosyltransferase involved in cell wall biosynthesis